MTTLSRPIVISPEGPSLLAWLNPVAFARTMVGHRNLIWQFVKRDLRNRTRGTHLGFAWDILNPLLMLVVYTIVFSSILEARLSGKQTETAMEYALYLFAGLTAFQMFAEPFGRSAAQITSKRNFVKKMAFPLEIFAISGVLTSTIHAAIGFALVFLAALLVTGGVAWTAVLLPLLLLPAVFLAIAAGWALGAMGVYFRDLQQFLGTSITRLLFFVTPIIYSVEMVPEKIRWILYLNPLTVVVSGVRSVVLAGEQPNWLAWGVWSAIGLVAMLLSYAIFMRARRGFADVI